MSGTPLFKSSLLASMVGPEQPAPTTPTKSGAESKRYCAPGAPRAAVQSVSNRSKLDGKHKSGHPSPISSSSSKNGKSRSLRQIKSLLGTPSSPKRVMLNEKQPTEGLLA